MEKLAVSWEIAVKVKATSVRKVLDTVTANYDTKSVPYRFAVRRERTHEREREFRGESFVKNSEIACRR